MIIARIRSHIQEKKRKKEIDNLRKETKSYIDYKCKIDHSAIIEDNVMLFYGDYRSACIGRGTYSYSSLAHIKVGRFCSISSNLQFINRAHPTMCVSSWPGLFNTDKNWNGLRLNKTINFDENLKTETGFICEIGNDVWIGANVSIKGGIKIGNGAVIGMNSVVTKDVPPYAIVGGNPANIIRYRFSQEWIDYLLSLKWWEWSIDEILKFAPFFDSPQSLKKAIEESENLKDK